MEHYSGMVGFGMNKYSYFLDLLDFGGLGSYMFLFWSLVYVRRMVIMTLFLENFHARTCR